MSRSRQIVVVEKDGVFRRLVEERFYDTYACILVTGVGVPDMPTRACVAHLERELQIPVYALVDWNPWGLAIVLCYKLGSARLGTEAKRYTVDVKWLGLRASQVARLGVGQAGLQALTARDRKRATDLRDSSWIAARATWVEEIQAQLDLGFKCELEALDVTKIADFVKDALVRQDFLV